MAGHSWQRRQGDGGRVAKGTRDKGGKEDWGQAATRAHVLLRTGPAFVLTHLQGVHPQAGLR